MKNTETNKNDNAAHKQPAEPTSQDERKQQPVAPTEASLDDMQQAAESVSSLQLVQGISKPMAIAVQEGATQTSASAERGQVTDSATATPDNPSSNNPNNQSAKKQQLTATVTFEELLQAITDAHERGRREAIGQAEAAIEAAKKAAIDDMETIEPPTPTARTYAPMPEMKEPDGVPTFLSNLRPGFWD